MKNPFDVSAGRAVRGVEPTRLLLVPGLDGTGIFFAPFIAALPPWVEARVVAFNALRPRSHAELAVALQAEIARTPACHLLAWSWGGPAAVLAAARMPQVKSLTLVSSFVRNPRPALQRFLRHANGPTIAAVRTLRRLPVWLGRRTADPFRIAKAQVWREVDARDLATRLRALPALDVRAELAATRQPLLCLCATEDRVVPAAPALADLRAAQPDAVCAELAGPHFALYFNPHVAAALVTQFIAAAASRAGSVAAPDRK